MRGILLFIFLLFLSFEGICQTKYWQQELSYTINIRLNEKNNSLSGSETITYKNNSPDPLSFIWFHLWPNAYDKTKNTALYAQLKTDRQHRRKLGQYKSGGIDSLSFSANGQPLKTEAHAKYADVIKVFLPVPLQPGDSTVISTPFRVKLPNFFSRSGFSAEQYIICQWYPKPAVYDSSGWHEFPYLDMGEFYSEYGKYVVNLSVPSSYVVAATGILQNTDELEAYRSIGSKNEANRSYKPLKYQYHGKNAYKTLTYKADSVPDFAWFASKNFVIQYADFTLKSGTQKQAFSFYFDNANSPWVNSIDYLKDATIKYSDWIGDYSYPVVQAVEGPANLNSGGMEYPMITLITSSDKKPSSLDGVITHEVGHNWFMSMIGSNERDYPWMDEGLNTYFELRYEAEKYRENSIFGDRIPNYLKNASFEDFQNNTYGVIATIPMKTEINKASELFKSNEDYALSSYVKPALWLYRLEQAIGAQGMNKAFRTYFQDWKFKHPRPQDLKSSFEKSVGFNLDAWFSLIYQRGGI